MDLPSDIALRRMRYDAAREAAWKRMLSIEEAARYAAFPSAERRRSFLLGRAAARTLLAGALGVPPPAVPLRIAADGAVDVDGGPCLSIAHSGGEAVAVAAPHAVGADLERVTPRRAGIERFMLHPSERSLPSQWPMERARALTLVWVLKEAVLKALRTGLRTSPTKLRLEDVDLGVQTARVRAGGRALWTVPFEEERGYYCAVAYQAGSGAPRAAAR